MPFFVKLSPVLRKYVRDYDHGKGIRIEQIGMSVGQLIKELNIPGKMVTSIIVNHRPSSNGYVVQDGDRILLAMIIGGG